MLAIDGQTDVKGIEAAVPTASVSPSQLLKLPPTEAPTPTTQPTYKSVQQPTTVPLQQNPQLQTSNQATSVYSGGDKDCPDFSTHAEAQAFFESAGAGDPHRLDGDYDGIACEKLP